MSGKGWAESENADAAKRSPPSSADGPMTAAPSPDDAAAPDPENEQALLDEAIEETFPASDAPAITQPTGPIETLCPGPVLGEDSGAGQNVRAADASAAAESGMDRPQEGDDLPPPLEIWAIEDPTRRAQKRGGLSDEPTRSH